MHIEVHDLTVVRSGRALLDGVSFEVGSGVLLGIVGPNGAGKSTLLRAMAGDIRPDHGSVSLGGHSVTEFSLQDLARRRAVVGPQTVSDVVFHVRNVVQMGRSPHGRHQANPHDDAVVVEAMRRTDVDHLAERPMRSLSSGEQQRVTLARALAQETSVLFLDEPTSALDIGHQELVMSILRDTAGSGATVVAVLHDLNLAAAYADRVLVLHSGAIAALGNPPDVLTSDVLTEVYRRPIAVVEHPFRDCPLVLTVD